MKKIIVATLFVLLLMTSMCSCGNTNNTTGTDENGNIIDDTKDNTATDDLKDAADDTMDGIENGMNDASDAIDNAVTNDSADKKDNLAK